MRKAHRPASVWLLPLPHTKWPQRNCVHFSLPKRKNCLHTIHSKLKACTETESTMVSLRFYRTVALPLAKSAVFVGASTWSRGSPTCSKPRWLSAILSQHITDYWRKPGFDTLFRAPASFLQLLLLPVLSIELNQRLNQLKSSANQGKNSRHDGENLKSWFSSQIHKNSLRLLPFSSRFLLLVTSSDVLGASLCAPQIPRMWPMAWNKKQNQQARLWKTHTDLM